MIEMIKQKKTRIIKSRFLFYCSIAFLITIVSVKGEFGAWKATLWLVNYDLEFVKRGFIGAFLQCINVSFFTQFDVLRYLSDITLYLLTFSFSFFVYFFYKNQSILLGVCLLFAGFSLQQFAYDLGRLDQVNYILLFISLYILSQHNSKYAILLVTLMSCVMLLITETSALIQVPIIFAALLISLLSKEYKFQLGILIYLSVVGITFFFVSLYGRLNIFSYETWLLNLIEISDFTPDLNAAEIFTRSLSDNFLYTINRLRNPKSISRFSIVFGVSLFAIIVMFKSWHEVRANSKTQLVHLLWLPVAAGLPLFVLGIDFYRWISYILLNYFILLGFYLNKANISFKLSIHYGWLIAWLMLSIYSGPYGVTLALPERMQIFKSLYTILSLIHYP